MRTVNPLRRIRLGEWPIFYKILLGVVTLITIALSSITFYNARLMRNELRTRIGEGFAALASREAGQLVDILSRQLNILQGVTLIESVGAKVAAANESYHGGAATIEEELLAADQAWIEATDDSEMVQAAVDPQKNPLAAQLLEIQRVYPDHVELFLTDKFGGLLASTNRTSDYYQADEIWWQEAYNEGAGAFFIGQPAFDESSGHTALNMAAPIYGGDGQGVIGIARTTYQVDALHEVLSELRIGETGHAILVDQDRAVIVDDIHTPSAKEQLPESWGTSAMMNMMSHWHELETSAGVPVITGHATLSGAAAEGGAINDAIRDLGWVLFVRQTQSEAYEPVSKAIRSGLVVTAAFILAISLMALGLARTVVTRLNDLVIAARQIVAGNLNVQKSARRFGEIEALAEQLREVVGQLEQRIAERTRALETSAEVSRRLSTILDEPQLIKEVVAQVRNAFDYYYVHIYLLETLNNTLVTAGGANDADRTLVERGYRIPIEKGLVGRAARTNRPVLVPDVTQNRDFLPNPLLPKTKSEMAVPIAVGDRVLGVLDVQHDVAGGLTQADVDLLQSIASQVATALVNARSYAESVRRANREELVNEINRKILGTPTVDEAMQVAVREIGRALGAKRTRIQLHGPVMSGERMAAE